MIGISAMKEIVTTKMCWDCSQSGFLMGKMGGKFVLILSQNVLPTKLSLIDTWNFDLIVKTKKQIWLNLLIIIATYHYE